MKFRSATDKDYDAVFSLMRQLNPEDPVIDMQLGRTLLTRILGADGLYIFLAEVEGNPVATCYLNVMPNLT